MSELDATYLLSYGELLKEARGSAAYLFIINSPYMHSLAQFAGFAVPLTAMTAFFWHYLKGIGNPISIFIGTVCIWGVTSFFLISAPVKNLYIPGAEVLTDGQTTINGTMDGVKVPKYIIKMWAFADRLEQMIVYGIDKASDEIQVGKVNAPDFVYNLANTNTTKNLKDTELRAMIYSYRSVCEDAVKSLNLPEPQAYWHELGLFGGRFGLPAPVFNGFNWELNESSFWNNASLRAGPLGLFYAPKNRKDYLDKVSQLGSTSLATTDRFIDLKPLYVPSVQYYESLVAPDGAQVPKIGELSYSDRYAIPPEYMSTPLIDNYFNIHPNTDSATEAYAHHPQNCAHLYAIVTQSYRNYTEAYYNYYASLGDSTPVFEDYDSATIMTATHMSNVSQHLAESRIRGNFLNRDKDSLSEDIDDADLDWIDELSNAVANQFIEAVYSVWATIRAWFMDYSVPGHFSVLAHMQAFLIIIMPLALIAATLFGFGIIFMTIRLLFVLVFARVVSYLIIHMGANSIWQSTITTVGSMGNELSESIQISLAASYTQGLVITSLGVVEISIAAYLVAFEGRQLRNMNTSPAFSGQQIAASVGLIAGVLSRGKTKARVPSGGDDYGSEAAGGGGEPRIVKDITPPPSQPAQLPNNSARGSLPPPRPAPPPSGL